MREQHEVPIFLNADHTHSLGSRVKMVELGEQIPYSLLPFLVFALFRWGDASKRSLFQSINLLLRELDQFIAELFSIARSHDMTSGRSGHVG